MELLPALAAESANPAHRGSNRQRNQRYECGKTHGDERALRDVFEHSRKIEGLVRSEISEKVQEDEKPQRPIAGGVLQVLNGIRAEVTPDNSPEQIAERDQADQKDCDFGPFADEDCAHL